MLVVAALLAGVAIGFYLAVVVITTAFEHPTSLECAPRRDYIRDLFRFELGRSVINKKPHSSQKRA